MSAAAAATSSATAAAAGLRFVLVARRIVLDPQLPGTSRLLYAVMAAAADIDHRTGHVGQRSLAARLDISVPTVCAHMEKLTQHGVVARTAHYRRSSSSGAARRCNDRWQLLDLADLRRPRSPRPKGPLRFGKASTAALLDLSLPIAARTAYLVLACLADPYERTGVHTGAEIAGYLGVSLSAAKRSLCCLVAAGWLKWSPPRGPRARGSATRWQLLDSTDTVPATGPRG